MGKRFLTEKEAWLLIADIFENKLKPEDYDRLFEQSFVHPRHSKGDFSDCLSHASEFGLCYAATIVCQVGLISDESAARMLKTIEEERRNRYPTYNEYYFYPTKHHKAFVPAFNKRRAEIARMFALDS